LLSPVIQLHYNQLYIIDTIFGIMVKQGISIFVFILIIALSGTLFLGIHLPVFEVDATSKFDFSGGPVVDSTLGLKISVPQGLASFRDDPNAVVSMNHCEAYCLLFAQNEDIACSDNTGKCNMLFPITIGALTTLDGEIIEEDDQSLKSIASDYTEGIPDFEVEDEGEIDINGKNAYYLSGIDESNGKYLNIFVPGNERIYLFNLASVVEQYQERLSFFEDIVMTTEILDSGSIGQRSDSGNPFGNNAGGDNSLGQRSDSGNPFGNNAGGDNSLGQRSDSGNPFGNNAGGDNSPIITDNGIGIKTYQNPDYGLELNLPSNWTASSPDDVVVSQLFVNPIYIQGFYPAYQKQKINEAILTLFFVPTTFHSISSYGSELYDGVLDWVNQNGVIKNAEITNIGGLDGGRITFITSETSNNASIVVDLFWMNYHEKGFINFAFISGLDGVKYMPVAKSIIQSIKITSTPSISETNLNTFSGNVNSLPTNTILSSARLTSMNEDSFRS
jgi:hypothetical protein